MTRNHMTRATGLLLCVLAFPLAAETVAVVNGERITRAEVDESIAARLASLEQQAYALRRGSLDNLITTALLRAEAKKEGISVEELRKRLSNATVQVTRADVEKEYAARPGAFDSLSTDEALERVRLDLESRARLAAYRDATAKLRASASIEVRLDAPRVDPGNPDADGAPFRGPRDARVVITEFADYECPYCRSSQPALDRLLEATAARCGWSSASSRWSRIRTRSRRPKPPSAPRSRGASGKCTARSSPHRRCRKTCCAEPPPRPASTPPPSTPAAPPTPRSRR